MRRRLIKQGKTTLTVSLPTKWIKETRVNAGEDVEILQEGNKLVISSYATITERKIEIDASCYSENTLKKYIWALYIEGFDEILIRFREPECTMIIQKAIESLIGFTILEEKPNLCIIRAVSEIKGGELHQMINRLHFLIEGLIILCIKSMKEEKTVKNIALQDPNLNRIMNFCLRGLNRGASIDGKSTSVVFETVWLLEFIGDIFGYDIPEQLSVSITKSKKINQKIIELFSEFQSVMQSFRKLFFDNRLEEFEKVYLQNKALRARISETMKEMPTESLILSELKKANDLLCSILELNLIGLR